jgi:hypothetical protein
MTKIYSTEDVASSTTKLSDVDLGYAAGFFDGEGCVQITWPLAHRERGWSPSIALVVVSTDRAPIDWLELRFGGYVRTRRPSDITYREYYQWHVTKKSTISNFLHCVLPYLQIKQSVASLGILLAETYLNLSKATTVDERERRGLIALKIMEWNQTHNVLSFDCTDAEEDAL